MEQDEALGAGMHHPGEERNALVAQSPTLRVLGAKIDGAFEARRDLLAATLDGALWHRLVSERGWSDERFAHMLGTMLVAALVW